MGIHTHRHRKEKIMAYEKIGWKDYPDKTTPINAQNLNHMDDQIAANAEKNDTQDQAIQKNEEDILALNESITTSAYKNGQLFTQKNVNLLDGLLTKNETRLVELSTAINSPIVSNGMALHKMQYTDSTYFTNIVTLFILDSSETWHNYYHMATKQWTGWVKS